MDDDNAPQEGDVNGIDESAGVYAYLRNARKQSTHTQSNAQVCVFAWKPL